MIPKMKRSQKVQKSKTTEANAAEATAPDAGTRANDATADVPAGAPGASGAEGSAEAGDNGASTRAEGPGVRLRTAYREHLDAFNADLLELCERVQGAMRVASASLLEQSLTKAEDAMTEVDALRDIHDRCEERGMSLLALESPVASDLRQVLSSIYIVENLSRMSSLAMHIATLTRARHPHAVIPDGLTAFIEEIVRLADAMIDETRELLLHPDADQAVKLHDIDDGMDDMKAYLLTLVAEPDWPYTTREAVDVAMVVRYYERFADRCVNVGNRIVFLVTGMKPDEYVREGEFDMQAKFREIEARFKNSR